MFSVNEINYLAGCNFQESSRFPRKTELHDVFTQAGPGADIEAEGDLPYRSSRDFSIEIVDVLFGPLDLGPTAF